MEIREKAVQVLKLMEGPGAENDKDGILRSLQGRFSVTVGRTLIAVGFVLCPVLE